MNCFKSKNRKKIVERVSKKEYDLAIIGGGITGAGIALDAASRGLKTVLIEKNDFASGTSSKSTKLIHGGLRYLKQFEIALVREVGRERAIVHNLAPHLVRSEKMLLPIIKDGTFGSLLTSFGLMVYDVLAGVEKADQRRMYEKEEAHMLEPLLREDLLEGGAVYAEYRTDDARLTVEILKTANTYGADMLNYAEAVDFIYKEDRISGLRWKDNLTEQKHELSASFTISAAGPWVDELRKVNNSLTGKHLHPTKGVHIVVPREKFPVKQSIYFDVPDGRMIFAIPRDRVTYVGTTDTDYYGDLNDVRTNNDDVHYLVDAVNNIFPSVSLTVQDVESTWVGLRPLIEEEGKTASQLSRKDEIFESDSGLLSIAGGKLTGYRKMAEKIVDIVAKRAQDVGVETEDCATDTIKLTGGPFRNSKAVNTYTKEIIEKLKPESLEHLGDYLVSNYGKQTDEILSIYHSRSEKNNEVKLGLAELIFTLDQESVYTLLDFFERRTGRLYFDIASIGRLRKPVLKYMKDFFEWDKERVKWETDQLDKAITIASEFE